MMPAGSIRAITLWQPYAELICRGIKDLETRSWAPPAAALGERLAIHAAKRDPDIGEHARDVAAAMALVDHGRPLPLGAVVATCTLADAFEVRAVGGGETTRVAGPSLFIDDWAYDCYQPEASGDFSLYRIMWILSDVEPLDDPIPAEGRQGLWWWTP